MNLRQQILKEHSKAQTLKIVDWIGKNQTRFDELTELFLDKDLKVAQRASWPLRLAATVQPSLVKKHFKRLLDKISSGKVHDGVIRNTIGMMEDVDIPEKFEGRVMDACFNYLTDPKEKAAVKASSLTVLQKLAIKYPEISAEIKTIIETQWPNEGPAFKARARRVLKTLK